MSMRQEKMQEALREAAAEFLSREAGRQSLITVTAAHLEEDGRSGIIFITVFPTEAERPALGFANRSRKEFGAFLQKKVKGMRPPKIEFRIDEGEKTRQRLDEIH